MASLRLASADFGLNLFRTVSEPVRNTCLSPASVSIALGMAYAGADGFTANLIQNLFFKGAKEFEIHRGLSKVLKVLTEPKSGYQLHAVNRLYGPDDLILQKDFVTILAECFQSQVYLVDLKNNPENVRQEIIRSVEEITKIRDILTPEDLTRDTHLLLLNAIYFKGEWYRKFDEAKTKEAIFYSAKEKETKVQMMHQETNHYLAYFENEEIQILRLPYIGCELDMYIFLPKDRYGLENFEKKLTGETLFLSLGKMGLERVIVDLPKFKLEESFNFNSVLANLGISDIFVSGVANFSKISQTKDLHVSQVIQKAFLEVDEKGTEISCKYDKFHIEQPQKQFNADHSFMFSIIHRETKGVLLMGRFTNLP